jgi:hypothetical protein
MTTKPPAKIIEEESSKPLKKIYTMVEELKDIIPVMNDRYRLGFCLNRYYTGEAGSIKEAVQSAKPFSCKISLQELEKIVFEKYNKLDLPKEK